MVNFFQLADSRLVAPANPASLERLEKRQYTENLNSLLTNRPGGHWPKADNYLRILAQKITTMPALDYPLYFSSGRDLERISRRQRATSVSAAVFAALAGVDLAALALHEPHSSKDHLLSQVAMWGLMPALIVVLLIAVPPPRCREVWLAVIALGFSWLGDAAPQLFESPHSFALKMGLFMVAQVVYIAAFVPRWKQTLIMRHPKIMGAQIAAVVASMIGASNRVGWLFPGVLVYTLLINIMAALSFGVSSMAGLGGTVFVISDSLIAVRQFIPKLKPPKSEFLIMATYLIGQALMTAGLARQNGTFGFGLPALSKTSTGRDF